MVNLEHVGIFIVIGQMNLQYEFNDLHMPLLEGNQRRSLCRLQEQLETKIVHQVKFVINFFNVIKSDYSLKRMPIEVYHEFLRGYKSMLNNKTSISIYQSLELENVKKEIEKQNIN